MWGSWRWAETITTSSMPWSSQLERSSFMARWKVFRRSVPVPGYGAQSGFVRP